MKKSKLLQSSKDMLHRSFKPDKCKTSLRLVTSRLKLLRNKKEVQVKQMRREIAQLLESGQDQTARIRVEHVVREEKMLAAYELISLYSELIMSRMPIIESQKNCPIDLKEAITSLVFASPRCGDVPELDDVRKQFTAKYGKEFINAAIELRPDSGVSRMLVEKLSARAPDGQTKLKILTAIAEEHSIEWDPKSFGENDIMTRNDFQSGPTTFEDTKVHTEPPRYEASTIRTPQSQMHEEPLQPEQNTRFSQGTENLYYTHPGGGGPTISSTSQHEVRDSGVRTESPVGKQPFPREGSSSSLGRQSWNMEFKDVESAAQAAAESAEQASMAARAAAELANRDRVKNQYFTESQRSGVHVQRDNTNEKHSSSKLAGEQFPKDSTSSFSTNRQPRSRNEKVEGVVYDNLRGADGRFDNGGYDSPKRYNQPTSSRSKASIDDDSFARGTQDADNYSQENLSEEGTDKPEIITRKVSRNSEYVSDLQESSRHENFDYIEKKNTVEKSVSSSRLDSNNYGDNNSSDFYRQNFESHAFADHFVGSDHGSIHRDISRSGSADAASTVSDESGSDDGKGLYDTGPKYDEPDSDIDVLSFGRKSPSNVFTNPDAWDSGFSNSRSPKKSVSSRQNSTKKHSSHGFSEVLRERVDDVKLDDSVRMKFDDSDGVHSESEESMDELGDSGTNYSAKLPGRGNRGLDQKPHLKLPPDELEFKEVQRMTNRKTELYSDSSKNFGSPQSPSGWPPQKVGKSELDLNDKESSESKISLSHEDKKSSERLVDDETLTQTSSDVESKLNFGKLTGGLRHKGYTLPPYTRSRLDDVSYLSKKPAEESSGTNLESPASPAAEFPLNSGANVHLDNKTSLRARNSLSDSDTDSSEDELPVQTSSHKKPYTQKAGKVTETKLILKGSVKYFESDSEEDLPKQTFAGRNNLGSRLSRRTKATPSVGTSKVRPAREEHKISDSGAGWKSASSSYGAQPLEEPESQTRSSGQSRNSEQPSSAKGSFEKATPSAGTSKVRPAREELKISDSGAEWKSASSSYGAQPLEKPESQTRSSGQSRNSEQPSSAKGSFKAMPDSKTSLQQESLKSTAAEQPASPQQKVDDAVGSTKSSQPSLSKGDTLGRVDSGKKASHVHPKLPDYDDLFAHLESLRKNRQ